MSSRGSLLKMKEALAAANVAGWGEAKAPVAFSSSSAPWSGTVVGCVKTPGLCAFTKAAKKPVQSPRYSTSAAGSEMPEAGKGGLGGGASKKRPGNDGVKESTWFDDLMNSKPAKAIGTLGALGTAVGLVAVGAQHIENNIQRNMDAKMADERSRREDFEHKAITGHQTYFHQTDQSHRQLQLEVDDLSKEWRLYHEMELPELKKELLTELKAISKDMKAEIKEHIQAEFDKINSTKK